eukprot:CAMPEP_0172357490 /NCGR_PEP_ID=MMETSP1060-20121228/1865_1 /TAXON_ID=37318 /ORGANISM="Pseudo-nitzschia pungens, Strain cf. cingulata" /LENGTH=521 /DNA_ID=CAMNT_0013078207 /DNA_START=156 /DNA_END=1721 /DNA_ORIENTATION=-
MNKFSVPTLALAATVVAAAAAASKSTPPQYVPTRISFEELAHGIATDTDEDYDDNDNGNDVFWKTLSEVGLLSITNVPNLNKRSMLRDLEDCLHNPKLSLTETDSNDNRIGAPDFALQAKNEDHHGGHRRRTLATHTLDGQAEGMFVATESDPNRVGNGGGDDACRNLRVSSRKFREAVQRASEAIAGRFRSFPSGVATHDVTNDNNRNGFLSVERVINEGEHLEHFHSYYSVSESHATTESRAKQASTIDWHTDQGMMLLFSPGQRQDGSISDQFLIRLKDGSTVEVDFDSTVDDLVIMLGDGVRQYVNSATSGNKKTKLRAVPHAVVLADSYASPRLWYGRMVLPPPNAIHPHSANSRTNTDEPAKTRTFGEIRDSMIRGEESALSLGCASSSIMVVARELSEGDGDEPAPTSCDEETSMLCWMRCMDYADYDVSPTSCEAEGDDYLLQCANDDGEIWETGHDSSYYLQCLATNTTDDDFDESADEGEEAPSSSSSSTWAVGGIASAAAMGFVMFLSAW